MSEHGDHCICDACMADPRDARIAELEAELGRQTAACESFRVGMLDREARNTELEAEKTGIANLCETTQRLSERYLNRARTQRDLLRELAAYLRSPFFTREEEAWADRIDALIDDPGP